MQEKRELTPFGNTDSPQFAMPPGRDWAERFLNIKTAKANKEHGLKIKTFESMFIPNEVTDFVITVGDDDPILAIYEKWLTDDATQDETIQLANAFKNFMENIEKEEVDK